MFNYVVLNGCNVRSELSGIVNARSNSQYKQIGKAATKATNIQEIIDYAKNAPNDNIRAIARQVNANNITDADAGRVYQYVVKNVSEKFDDIYTVEELNAVVNEYFLGDTPKAIKDIASATFANKLVEMNVEPETNEAYNSLTNSINTTLTDEETQLLNTPDSELTTEQRAEKQDVIEKLQSKGNDNVANSNTVDSETYSLQDNQSGGIINQGGEENGRIYNQGTVGGENYTDTGRKHEIRQSRKTIDGYVEGGKGEILSGGNGETPRRVRINHTKNSSVTFTEGEADNTEGYKAYTAFANAGIKVIYCNGSIERTVSGVTVSSTEAFTAPDGTVYISSESSLPAKQTFDHEKVHVADKTKNPAYKSYVTILCYEIDFSSDSYKENAAKINRNHFNNKYDINDKKTYPIFMCEIAAYINQFVLSDPAFAEQTFGGMFSDWGAVVEAVNKFNTDMGADFTESANFMPENEDTPSSESGEYGLSEPSDQEIHREPTKQEYDEAMFGKMKNAKQRHILDVAGKLDSGMKVVFVGENAEVLSGQKGVYMRDSNTMYLSESNSAVESYYQLFKHEFIHRLESKGAYQSFKNYLFRNSSSFERYARAQLGKDFEGNREEALHALAQKYIDTVQKGKFSQDYKNSFTEEDAQREMVADFISEVLFKGNRKDVAQHLSESNLNAIFNIEDTLTEFENLTETDRNWFQKIIDTIKDFIASLKGVNQNKRLVEDLEYIEKRLGRVLDSKDTKKAASRAGDKQFSIKAFKDGRQFVDVDVDQKRFNGLNDNELRREAKKVIKEKFLGKVIGENNRAYVKKDSAEEYAYPSKYIQDSNIIEAKMRASTELDNLIDVGDNYRNEPDGKYGHSHPEATGGFDYYDAIFKVGNKYYYGLVNIMVTNRGRVFKDLTKIEDITNDIIAQYGNNPQGDFVGTSSTDIIDEKTPIVKDIISDENDNYSESPQKTKGQFSLGSPAQQMRDNLKKYESGEITEQILNNSPDKPDIVLKDAGEIIEAL